MRENYTDIEEIQKRIQDNLNSIINNPLYGEQGFVDDLTSLYIKIIININKFYRANKISQKKEIYCDSWIGFINKQDSGKDVCETMIIREYYSVIDRLNNLDTDYKIDLTNDDNGRLFIGLHDHKKYEGFETTKPLIKRVFEIHDRHTEKDHLINDLEAIYNRLVIETMEEVKVCPPYKDKNKECFEKILKEKRSLYVSYIMEPYNMSIIIKNKWTSVFKMLRNLKMYVI